METLWHGTSDRDLSLIRQSGILPPSYWGSRRIAEYYAEVQSRQDGGEPVVLGVPFSQLETCLEPDVRSVEEPLTFTLGKSEEQVWEEWDWDRDDHTFRDSLEIVESAQCTDLVPFSSVEEIHHLRGGR